MIDEYTKLNIGFDNVECVIHLADIHIRLTSRHQEYREVFDRVYEYIKKSPERTLVVVAGDLAHNKCEMSPESVQLACDFLKSLSDIRPTILIAGNHDTLLTNNTRLDSLTPIVEALNHKQLFYLKKTALYGAGNILFNNMSVFDDVTKYLDIKKITKKIQNHFDVKIALFHGAIHGSKTDIGYLIENRACTTDRFEGHDIVMLGDIHKEQTFYIDRVLSVDEAASFSSSPDSDNWDVIDDVNLVDGIRIRLKNSPIFRYSGSVVMQNHGESLVGHGFTVWDIKTRTYTHIEIPNDYGYFTIEITDGKLVTDISGMPKKPKLRVKCKESVASEVKKIIAEIRDDHEITDLMYMRIDSADEQKSIMSKTTANLDQITNVDYQNTLIESYLRKKYSDVMDDDTIGTVKEINKVINSAVTKDDRSRNIRWKPIKFEFSNMFSYGENNVIDFTKMTDVYGLFAANTSGKSSIADAMCFTMFDKSARAYKASHVMNSQKMSFSGKFTFEINGVKYTITRSGTRNKKNDVKVDVSFYKNVDGKEISLNSEARRSTNEIIRDYLGNYDDFVLTSLALQGNQGSFVDMGQTERKDLLSQFIGLNIFDSIFIETNNHIKELSGAIKMFNKEDNETKVKEMEALSVALDGKISDLARRKRESDDQKSNIESQLEVTRSKIIVLENVPTDINSLLKIKKQLITSIDANNEELMTLQSSLTSMGTTQKQYQMDISKFDISDLKEKMLMNKDLNVRLSGINTNLDKLKTLVSTKIAKIKHLETHEYDPNCKYCCNNVFVKDATTAKESLSDDKTQAITLKKERDEVLKQIDETSSSVTEYDRYQTIEAELTQCSTKIAQVSLKISNIQREVERQQSSLVDTDEKIGLYEKSKEAVEINRSVQVEIDRLVIELRQIVQAQKLLNDDYVSTYSKKVSYTDQITTLKDRIKLIEKSEGEYSAYQYYLDAIGKDGIPYQIISSAVPRIEQEVNNILTQIVDFTISIETDGKNVNVFIKYDDKRWPLELCSGMEKFISALALRVSLINISNLPRAPMLIVDEGMSALDASNMAMVHALFDYLKTNFDFIIVISHLDVMRDMVDKQLEIKKENGFSKIDNR